MSDRPLLAKDIYAKYVSIDGRITIPNEDNERKLLARALLGVQLISQFDYWMDYAVALNFEESNVKDSDKQNVIERREKYFHERFQSLNNTQKSAVRNLVREISKGILFSNLVALDQCKFGEFNFSLKVKDSGVEIPILSDPLNDLHDELNNWLISFSKYGDEILELIETKVGWQFKPKDFEPS